MDFKKIVLVAGPSACAYKTYDLAELLVNAGYMVYTALTEDALEFVSPILFENITGNPVFRDDILWRSSSMPHLSLKDDAAMFLAAPADAGLIGKFANGIADDLVSTTFLSCICPSVVVPAMEPCIWRQPAIKMNIEKLKMRGTVIVGTEEDLTADTEKVFEVVHGILTR